MKKIFILFSLSFTWFISKSQITNTQFESIKQLIKEADPKANIEEKLIMVSFWSPDNKESRELNKEINRVSNIYKSAKLKGGKNGVYFFNYCLDEDLMNYKLAIKRDSLNINASFLQNENSKTIIKSLEINQPSQTILFNSIGDVIEVNTKKEAVFKLMSKQITR
jgi:hypothetical protein